MQTRKNAFTGLKGFITFLEAFDEDRQDLPQISENPEIGKPEDPRAWVFVDGDDLL